MIPWRHTVIVSLLDDTTLIRNGECVARGSMCLIAASIRSRSYCLEMGPDQVIFFRRIRNCHWSLLSQKVLFVALLRATQDHPWFPMNPLTLEAVHVFVIPTLNLMKSKHTIQLNHTNRYPGNAGCEGLECHFHLQNETCRQVPLLSDTRRQPPRSSSTLPDLRLIFAKRFCFL